VGGELVDAGDPDHRAGRERRLQRGGGRGARVAAVVARKHQPEGRAPVGGDEPPVTDAGIRHHPPVEVQGDRAERSRQGLPDAGGVDRGGRRQGDDRHGRVRVAAGPVGLGDGEVGLVAPLAGQGEVVGQPLVDGRGERDAGGQDGQPADHDQPPVPEQTM